MFAETLDRELMRQMFKYVFECTGVSIEASHQKIALNGKARLILICRRLVAQMSRRNGQMTRGQPLLGFPLTVVFC